MPNDVEMPETESRLDAAVLEYLREAEAGRPPNVKGFLAKYPDLADPLREFLAEQDFVDGVVRPLRNAPSETEPIPDPSMTTPHGPPPNLSTGKWQKLLKPPSDPGDVGRLGRYRVLGVLGEGGMGVVFRAFDTTLQRAVALKVMQPRLAGEDGAKERFLREAQAMAQLDHVNVIPVLDVTEVETPDGSAPMLSMPLLDGFTLADRLKRDGKLSVPEAIAVGKQVAEGLAAAHGKSLIHRDIKPSNLWLEPTGRVRVLDFGLVRSTGAGSATVTGRGVTVGTPAYMSPEQAEARPTDEGTDLFSLGVVLYESLTGDRPFAADSAASTMVQVINHQPKPARELNPEVPAALSGLVERLMAKDRQNRPADAAAVVGELAALEEALRTDKGATTTIDVDGSPPHKQGIAIC